MGALSPHGDAGPHHTDLRFEEPPAERLGYDRRVGPVPARERSQSAVARALLLYNRLQYEVAREPDARLHQRPRGVDHRRHPGLHVRSTAPVHLAG